MYRTSGQCVCDGERERERDYQAFEYAQAPNPPLPSHIEPADWDSLHW